MMFFSWKKKCSILCAAVLMTFSAFAGTVSPARTAVDKGQFDKAISILAADSLKGAEEWYLLGQAYFKSGKKLEAHGAWNECIQINKSLAKRDKWTFLFPPNKRLSGKQKSKLKSEFESTFTSLTAAVVRNKGKEKKSLTTDAARKRIEATRKEAEAKMLNKKADAKTEKINEVQRVADRQVKLAEATNKKPKQTKKPVRRTSSGGGGKIGGIIIAIIILLAVLGAIFGRKSNGSDEDEFMAASFGTTRYDVGRNGQHFNAGPFWHEGRYFHSQRHFYNDRGYHYTNDMYLDNYDRYGMGQGRDTGLDHEILENIEEYDREIMETADEREELRSGAADAGYEADVLEADAKENELDADLVQDDIEEFEDSVASFDDGTEFEDDEEPEFEDDPVEEEPVEEEVAEEEEFEDDPVEEEVEEEEFEDDPE